MQLWSTGREPPGSVGQAALWEIEDSWACAALDSPQHRLREPTCWVTARRQGRRGSGKRCNASVIAAKCVRKGNNTGFARKAYSYASILAPQTRHISRYQKLSCHRGRRELSPSELFV